jgi:arylsulfatase A-like enzyme
VSLLFLLACGARLPAGDATRPDIVLVSIDSLRADHLGAWGYARPTSPFLDRLAREGTQFTDARSASPWTLPSHWTMLTGRWPWEHGVVEDTLTLRDGVPTLPEALSAAGYATGAFVSTVYVSRAFGFDRGFQRFEDHGISTANNLAHAVRADTQVDQARAWAQEAGAGKPLFLFLHLYDVHYPYACPPPWDSRFDRPGRPGEDRYRTYAWYKEHPLGPARLAHQVAQYDECIAWTDSQLERLHDAWQKSGRKAVFAVTADHGEELGERGSWGHAHTLHPEQLHVPLLLWGDGIPVAKRTERAGTIDLAATLAGVAGLPAWSGPGVDLRRPVPERPFGGETARFASARLSWEDGPWRLDADLAGGEVALYDHRSDPSERSDVSAAEPQRAEQLRSAMIQAVDPGGWTLAAGARARMDGKGAAWSAEGMLGNDLEGPRTFGAWPPDAPWSVRAGETTLRLDGAADPKAQASTAPLRRTTPGAARPVQVESEVREALEALGYVQ